MPVIHERSVKGGCRLAIWQITESLKEFEEFLDIVPEHESKLSTFRFDKRKLEWICSRVLVKHLIPELEQVNIIYDINGKPHLEPSLVRVSSHAKNNNQTDIPPEDAGYHISISHSGDYVAVMVCKDSPVGIDIETIRDKILTISKRFVNEDELKMIDKKNIVEHTHVIWGAKEVLFKLYAKGELDFLKHIFTDKFIYKGKGELKAYILKDSFAKSYSLCYEKINNLMLVYGIDV